MCMTVNVLVNFIPLPKERNFRAQGYERVYVYP